MWDETLIESMGKRNNGKRWLTVQVAAIVHAGIVAILAAASFLFMIYPYKPRSNFRYSLITYDAIYGFFP